MTRRMAESGVWRGSCALTKKIKIKGRPRRLFFSKPWDFLVGSTSEGTSRPADKKRMALPLVYAAARDRLCRSRAQKKETAFHLFFVTPLRLRNGRQRKTSTLKTRMTLGTPVRFGDRIRACQMRLVFSMDRPLRRPPRWTLARFQTDC